MLELLQCFALGTAMLRAVRARHRGAFWGGVAVAYLIAADILGALAGNTGPQHPLSLFNYVFLGPSVAVLRASSLLPLPSVLLHYPLWLRALRASLCWALAWLCLRESSRLNPLLPRAYVLDGIGLPFAGAAVVDMLEGILLLFAITMSAQG